MDRGPESREAVLSGWTQDERRYTESVFSEAMNSIGEIARDDADAAGWPWLDTPGVLMQIVSELAEAMEADRRDAPDKHLPERRGLEVELADAIIRIAGFAAHLGFDLGGAIIEKMEFNRAREDHQPESRKAAGGKRY